jgi:hypothetical protein
LGFDDERVFLAEAQRLNLLKNKKKKTPQLEEEANKVRAE